MIYKDIKDIPVGEPILQVVQPIGGGTPYTSFCIKIGRTLQYVRGMCRVKEWGKGIHRDYFYESAPSLQIVPIVGRKTFEKLSIRKFFQQDNNSDIFYKVTPTKAMVFDKTGVYVGITKFPRNQPSPFVTVVDYQFKD